MCVLIKQTLSLSVQLMGEEFIQAIHPVLQERWTSDLEEAWKVNRVDVYGFFRASREKLTSSYR